MGKPTVAVVTDSSSALGPALCSRWGIAVVPTRIVIGASEYRDEVNISLPRVVAELMAGSTVEVLDPLAHDLAITYGLARDAGASSVVSIHASPQRHHDTLGVARAAAREAGMRVEVIDSQALSLAQGFSVLAAASVAAAGGSHDEVVAAARGTAQGSRLVLTVEDPRYLYRNRIVPKWVTLVAKLNSKRSVMELRGAQARALGLEGDPEAARRRVIAEIEETAATMANPVAAVAFVGSSASDVGLLPAIPGSWGEQPAGASIAATCGPGTFMGFVAPMPPHYAADAVSAG